MQSDSGQDGELGARIEAVDVFGGIGLGEAQLLRLPQSGGKGNAVGFDLTENVVAGAVENASNLEQFVAAQSIVQSRNHGHAARYGRAKLDLLVHLARQADQFESRAHYQLLVGSDYGFA